MAQKLQRHSPKATANTRFVATRWYALRALLVLCLLFAVGATETEGIRFQTKQPRPTGRLRQLRHGRSSRGVAMEAHHDGLAHEAVIEAGFDLPQIDGSWLQANASPDHQPSAAGIAASIAASVQFHTLALLRFPRATVAPLAFSRYLQSPRGPPLRQS